MLHAHCVPALRWPAFHFPACSLPAAPTYLPQVDSERDRFSVALKQSLCGGKDAAYLRSLFR